jgi:hypothetical protein
MCDRRRDGAGGRMDVWDRWIDGAGGRMEVWVCRVMVLVVGWRCGTGGGMSWW